MPSSAQIREERIKQLVSYGLSSYDCLYAKAMDLWPYIHERTRHSYIIAAMKITRARKLTK